MMTLQRGTQIVLAACLVLATAVPISAQTCDTKTSCTSQAGAAACGTSCDTAKISSGACGGATCERPAGEPLCSVSGASCGALVPVDFDPALNADRGSPGRTAEDLGFQNLNELLEPVRARYRVPALAIAVARSDGVFAVGAVGVRVAGAATRVTPTDQFHLGSCGKSITASVAARMVERGQIRWDATIADVFAGVPGAGASVYRSVTLQELLAHRSGLPPRDEVVMNRVRSLTGNTRSQREQFVRMALTLPPVATPGSTFVYTDVGYTVAGVMLERAAGKPWEELVEEYVAKPLHLSSLGFGEPANPGSMDQPWGHVAYGARTIPFAPGPYAAIDNPAVIGPAGLVHMSIIDWGTFASEHLRGDRGQKSAMLSPNMYQVLHADVNGQNYGLGWGVSQGESGRVLTHTGSCGEWFSAIRLIPDADLAIVVATNVSGGNGVAACGDALQDALTRFSAAPQIGKAAATRD